MAVSSPSAGVGRWAGRGCIDREVVLCLESGESPSVLDTEREDVEGEGGIRLMPTLRLEQPSDWLSSAGTVVGKRSRAGVIRI